VHFEVRRLVLSATREGLYAGLPRFHAKHSATALAKRKHHASPYNRCSMRHKVTLIAGEGIGPEVAAATRRIIEASGVLIDWEEIEGRTDKVKGLVLRTEFLKKA